MSTVAFYETLSIRDPFLYTSLVPTLSKFNKFRISFIQIAPDRAFALIL